MAKQEGGMWLYKAGVPRFSLVLWSKPFREGKLRLPKGFAKEHGAQLANEVLLKLPNGAEWQVSVVRGRKRIWFVKGWREFAEFYSLKPTNYLVFGLVSRGRLNVIIFDTTATEIDYSNTKVNVKVEPDCDVTSNEAVQRPSPSSPKATVKPSLKPHQLRTKNVKGRTASGEELDGNGKQGKQIKDEHRSCTPWRTKSAYRRTDNERANVVFESENPRATESGFTCRPNKHGNSPKTRDKPSLGFLQPHKLRRTNGMDGIASSSKGQNRNKTPRGKTSSIPTEEAGPLARGKTALTPAMEAANAFTSNQPFFKTTVTHASLKRLQVSMPVAFWNHTKKGARKMELRVGSQVWEVSVNRYEADLEKNRVERVFINGGWGQFAEGNSLVPGDVCVFELIKGEQEEDVDADDNGLETTVACVHVFRG